MEYVAAIIMVQHAQPEADAERQQPILSRAGELAERLAHTLQAPSSRRRTSGIYLATVGSSSLTWRLE